VIRTNLAQIIDSNPITLAPTDATKTAMAMMVAQRQTCVFVIDNHQLLGIFTERDAMRRLAQQRDLNLAPLSEVMTAQVKTVTVEESRDEFAIAQAFLEHRIRHLPVVDQQRQVIGLITPQSLSRRFQPEHLLRCLRVSEVMTSHVLVARRDESLLDLIQRMAAQRVSCIVITDPVTQIPLGIITERDITRLHGQIIEGSITSWANVTADQVMTHPLVTKTPLDSLWSVHEQMQQMNIRRVVIAHPSGVLAGLITQTQMLKMMDPVEIYQVMQQMRMTIAQQTKDLRRLNQELRIANQELQALATVDELTQVANRRAFNQFLTQVWQRAAHDRQPIALLLIDIDHFKAYNDAYGHIAGDQCLSRIARLLQSLMRQSNDFVARYGGEEFVIVLPDTDAIGADRVAREIIQRMQEIQIPHQYSVTTDHVTVSIGVYIARASSEYNEEILIDQADRALYEAKQQGRNRYVFGAHPS
jgi:diguanylate cyclase (GGDEF)-like protein